MFSGLTEYTDNFKINIYDKNNIYIILFVVILIVVSIYLYYSYVKPILNPEYIANKEFLKDNNENDENVADLYLFYTTWCPHCKTTKPIWQELKGKLENKKVNDVKINFIEIDCEKEKEIADKFKIEGYPTIKMVYKGQLIEYDAKPNIETLEQFLNSYL